MWEKLVNRFRSKDKTAPKPNLGEELCSLDIIADFPTVTAVDSGKSTEPEAKLAAIKQGLHKLAGEELLKLARDIWGNLGPKGKETLYRELQAKDIINKLLADLSGTNKPKQVPAVELLGKFQVNEALPKLVELLSSSDLGVVLAATGAVKNYPSGQTLPLLLETLEDPRRWPPARVAEAIINYGPGIAPVLADSFLQIKGDARVHLVEILGRLGAKEGIPVLCTAMSADQPSLRQKGAWAAGQLGVELASGSQVVELLQALRGDSVAGVRAQAVESLWRLDPERAWPFVQAALLDKDRIVRGRAAGILGDRQDLPREIWTISGKKELTPEDKRALEAWLEG